MVEADELTDEGFGHGGIMTALRASERAAPGTKESQPSQSRKNHGGAMQQAEQLRELQCSNSDNVESYALLSICILRECRLRLTAFGWPNSTNFHSASANAHKQCTLCYITVGDVCTYMVMVLGHFLI
jgi:hypothetical protein